MSHENIPKNFEEGFSINNDDVYADTFRNNQGIFRVRSWDGLVQVISFLISYKQPYYWRGQADTSWDIDSLAKRNNIDEHSLSDQLAIFKKAGRAYLAQGTDDEILVLGRHHGLATPLIDFSETAYKALFFACEAEPKVKNNPDGDRALVVFDRRNFKGWDRKTQYVQDIDTHFHVNHRLIAQDGLILKLPLDKHLEQIMDDLSAGDIEPLLFKIVFPESIREQALINLMHMGITYKTMYPDLHGAAMFSNMASKIRGYQLMGVSVPPQKN